MTWKISKHIQLPFVKHVELEAVRVANQLMTRAKMSENCQTSIRLAIFEALINAVEHSRSPDKKVDVYFDMTSEEFKITIRDKGIGFNPLKKTSFNFKEKRKNREIRGWGLQMMQKAMDQLDIYSDRTGTTLVMIKKLNDNRRCNDIV